MKGLKGLGWGLETNTESNSDKNRVTSIGPWICHNALRHIHGTKLFLKGKNDTCSTLGLYESVRPGRMCLGRC